MMMRMRPTNNMSMRLFRATLLDAQAMSYSVGNNAGILAGPARFAIIALRDVRTAAALFKVLFSAQRIMAWVHAVDFSNITDWIRSHPRKTKIVGAGLAAACLCPLLMGRCWLG